MNRLNTKIKSRTFHFPIRHFTITSYNTSKSLGAKGVQPFVDDAEDYDLNKDYERLSLDKFYASLAQFTLTDQLALEYMTFASKMACINFKTESEMLAFKGDFIAALAFVSKLDDIDVQGVEPLGNVFEYYEGNELKMRGVGDFEGNEKLNFSRKGFSEINVHARKDGTYSVLPVTKEGNPDGE